MKIVGLVILITLLVLIFIGWKYGILNPSIEIDRIAIGSLKINPGLPEPAKIYILEEETRSPPELKIETFKIGQNVFRAGDNITIDFIISNQLNVSYNITADWLHNNKRFIGWSNVSINNKTYNEDALKKFRVI